MTTKSYVIGQLELKEMERTLHVLCSGCGEFKILSYTGEICDGGEDYEQSFSREDLVTLRDGISELLKKFKK